MLTSISGFPEWLPEDRIVEQMFIDTIRQQFELFGFTPLETRSVEPKDTLTKGGETDKEIYMLTRLQADDADEEEADLGLHFDMTVPFARFVSENWGRMVFPVRRYQIQKAWRGERPQAGRYREFYQADIDIIGQDVLPITADLDMVQALHDVMYALPVPRVRIHVNNRKVLEGFYRALGISNPTEVLRIVDKLDKVGEEGVQAMLIERGGLTSEQAERCIALGKVNGSDADAIREQVMAFGLSHDLLDEGLDELAVVLNGLRGIQNEAVIADLSIARGLDYYTGTVMEGKFIHDPDYPTVCSGGRYDNLVEAGASDFPGVGVSIGVTRIMAAVLDGGLLKATRKTPSCVLIALVSDDQRGQSVDVAYALRKRGIPCEVYGKADRFGKQIKYADRKGIPFVWFPGEQDEVKDIRSGEQVPADADTWEPPEVDRIVRMVTITDEWPQI